MNVLKSLIKFLYTCSYLKGEQNEVMKTRQIHQKFIIITHPMVDGSLDNLFTSRLSVCNWHNCPMFKGIDLIWLDSNSNCTNLTNSPILFGNP